MTPTSKFWGSILLGVVGAVAIIGTALWTKGTSYQNAWLYVFSAWIILMAAFEAGSNLIIHKNKNK